MMQAPTSGAGPPTNIVFKGTGDAGNATTNNFSGNYTVNTASNILWVAIGVLGANDLTAVTYNGVAMTFAASNLTPPSGLEFLYLYYLVNPTHDGAPHAINVTRTASAYVGVVAADYAGATTTGVVDNTATAQTNTGPLSWTHNVNTPSSWIVAASAQSTAPPTAGTNLTLRTSTVTFTNPTIYDTNGVPTPEPGAIPLQVNAGATAITAVSVSFGHTPAGPTPCGALQTDYSVATGCNALGFALLR